METNPNIIRLLEMLDNPDAYSEQEIRDIINKDDETREAYRLIVAARQGYRNKEEEWVDVDEGWERLEASPLFSSAGKESAHPKAARSRMKIAASVVGILLAGAIAYAACVKLGTIHLQTQRVEAKDNKTIPQRTTAKATPAGEQEGDATKSGPVTYDNIPLEKMLPEIAAYYGFEVTFKNDEARQLRFHFVWNREEGIDKVVENINHFESLSITLNDKQLIVE